MFVCHTYMFNVGTQWYVIVYSVKCKGHQTRPSYIFLCYSSMYKPESLIRIIRTISLIRTAYKTSLPKDVRITGVWRFVIPFDGLPVGRDQRGGGGTAHSLAPGTADHLLDSTEYVRRLVGTRPPGWMLRPRAFEGSCQGIPRAQTPYVVATYSYDVCHNIPLQTKMKSNSSLSPERNFKFSHMLKSRMTDLDPSILV